MARGQHARSVQRRPKPAPVVHAPAETEHAKLVAALPPVIEAPEVEPEEVEEPAQTITSLIASDIRAANQAGRHGDAGSIEVLAVRLGEVINALPAARAVASSALADALTDLASLL